MKKYASIVKNLLLNNSIIIITIFLIFLKPYFFSSVNSINLVCNILLVVFSTLIYFYSFYNNKISKYQKILIVFLLVTLLSTILFSHSYATWIKNFIKISSISLYTELLIKNNLDKFLKSMTMLLYVLIFLTFITTIIWPNGIFGNEMIFLGYDNSTIILLIFGAMFILFSHLYIRGKQDIKNIFIGLIPFIMVLVIYYIRWSVGALIGCIIILVMIFMYILFKKCKMQKIYNKLFSLKSLFIISIVIFLLIVVFGIQKYFSFIIVDIFHKDITLTNRTYIWEACFAQIKLHPILGMGMMDFESRLSIFGIYHAHSNFLNIILESGVLGFLLYIYLWNKVIKSVSFVKDNLLKVIYNATLFSFLIMTIIDVIDNCELLYVFLVIGYYLPYIINKTKENNNLENILVLIDSGQPIPAINGGAIETLVDSFIKENEKNNKYNIDVYSMYDKGINELKSKDKYTTYNYINGRTLSYFMVKCINYAYKRVFNKNNNVFAMCVLDYIEIQDRFNYYDKIIIENNPYMIMNLNKKIDTKYILHVHNDINNLDYDSNCLNKYYKIICCSNFVTNRIKNECSNKNVVTVYNGVNTKELLRYNKENIKKKLRRKYKIPYEGIVFGYCGRICEDKGTKELIEAFKKIAKENKNVFLVLTGNSFFKNSKVSPYIKSLIECCSDFQDRIIFTGYIDHSKIGKFYSLIDIYVQPSIVNEACPLTIIESQIMNKILLSTDSGGIPELIKNKNSTIISRKNIVIDMYKEMNNILKNYEKLKNIKIDNNILNIYDETTFSINFLNEID